MATAKPSKTRRIPGTPRARSDDFGAGFLSLSFGRSDPMNEGSEPVSILPTAFRSRLYGLFNQIEREFEALYSENLLCKHNPQITVYCF